MTRETPHVVHENFTMTRGSFYVSLRTAGASGSRRALAVKSVLALFSSTVFTSPMITIENVNSQYSMHMLLCLLHKRSKLRANEPI